MGSFSAAANGATSQAADINQFYTALTAGTSPVAYPLLATAPASSKEALKLTLPTWTSGSNKDFLSASDASDAAARLTFSYNGGGTGTGYLSFSNGAAANVATLYGVSNGLRTDQPFTVGGNLLTNGGTSPATLQVNGNFTVGGNLTVGSGTPTVSALAGGAPVYGASGGTTYGLQIVDDGNTVLTLAPYNSNNNTARTLSVWTWNGSAWVNPASFDSGGAHSGGLDLRQNSLSRVSYISGTGGGTFTHGLGAVPTHIGITYSGSGTATVCAYNYFGQTSTFQVNAGSGQTWRAWALAY